MVTSLNWSTLKNIKLPAVLIGLGIFLLAVLLSQNAYSQTNPVANTALLTEVVSMDRLGNVYVADRKNNLRKYDATGKLVTTFSPPGTGHIALIEAWNPAKILLFYDDQQKIIFLDRFLTPVATTRLSDYVDGLIKTASFSTDNKIWAFNESNFSLHKLDLQYPEASRAVPLDLMLNKQQYDIRLVREYQNNVYLVDRLSGIYVFDNLGNYQKKLPFTGLTYVGFQGDELYYLSGGKIHFFHLYTLQQRTMELASVGANGSYLQALIGDSVIYLISESGLEVKPLN